MFFIFVLGTRCRVKKKGAKKMERHEYKYVITKADRLGLSRKLSAVMKPDVHANSSGRYLIRSIYFENYKDKALREKTDGVPYREKFRIRWYNDDLSYIVLEKKIKSSGLCRKISTRITKDELEKTVGGENGWMISHPSPLVRELYCKMQFLQLRPKTLVSYEREAYTFPAGNVRVTFDSKIKTGASELPATDDPETTVLEVKYDAFLPDAVANLLQSGGFRVGAFSKYGACRRFG